MEEELPRKIVHDVVNDRWEVAVTASPGSFQQASFVNSIATTKVHAMTGITALHLAVVCVIHNYTYIYMYRAVASGPAGPVLAGPVFRTATIN